MNKKIALVHDYIKEFGGAERVLEELHNLYPEAPIYTLVYCPQFLGPHKDRFQTFNIKTTILQYFPFKHKFISLFRLISPILFNRFDFSDFDIIIVSSSGAYTPNFINKKNAKQVCYCHTPPRYLYGYATARDWKKNYIFKILGELANHILRMIDYASSQRVDLYIANSVNVKKRIQKFYRRNAIVIYPPVVTGRKVSLININKTKRTYYLTGGRLARPKHYDIIIKACNELHLPLKVFGTGFAGYGDELKQLAGSTVEFLDEVSDQKKMALMNDAKAFIFAGEDEDFGITPVEAMSVGTPVLAYKSGGLLESIIDGKTGLFFDILSVECLIDTIKRFEKVTIDSNDCISQAKKFSVKQFSSGIINALKSL